MTEWSWAKSEGKNEWHDLGGITTVERDTFRFPNAIKDVPRQQQQKGSSMVRYFGVKAVFMLALVTATLLFLPLVVPPLPPPPLWLLLIPVGIMLLLGFLALLPSNITNISSISPSSSPVTDE